MPVYNKYVPRSFDIMIQPFFQQAHLDNVPWYIIFEIITPLEIYVYQRIYLLAYAFIIVHFWTIPGLMVYYNNFRLDLAHK